MKTRSKDLEELILLQSEQGIHTGTFKAQIDANVQQRRLAQSTWMTSHKRSPPTQNVWNFRTTSTIWLIGNAISIVPIMR